MVVSKSLESGRAGPSPKELPELVVPLASKRSGGFSLDDGPSMPKTPCTSQLSQAPRRPPSISSLSSRLGPDAASVASISPLGLGHPSDLPPLDPILMRLSALEDTNRRNFEETARRVEEIRRLYEMQLAGKRT